MHPRRVVRVSTRCSYKKYLRIAFDGLALERFGELIRRASGGIFLGPEGVTGQDDNEVKAVKLLGESALPNNNSLPEGSALAVDAGIRSWWRRASALFVGLKPS